MKRAGNLLSNEPTQVNTSRSGAFFPFYTNIRTIPPEWRWFLICGVLDSSRMLTVVEHSTWLVVQLKNDQQSCQDNRDQDQDNRFSGRIRAG